MTPTVPGFLSKTYEIFNNPEFSDCCGWGALGETIVIRKIDQFSKNVLPKYFKHSNFQSFVRQLNMYDFHKTVQDPSHGEFQHQYFKKNRPDLLVYIKRKAHNKTTTSSNEILQNTNNIKKINKNLNENNNDIYSNNQFVDNYGISKLSTSQRLEKEAELVLSEINQQANMRNEIETRLHNLESQHGQLENENAYLRRLVVESNEKQALMQERMENVLRALYMYVNGANSVNNVPQLLGRMPSLLLADSLNPASVMRYIEDSSLPLSAITEGPTEDPLLNIPSDSDGFGLGLELSQQNSFDASLFQQMSSFDVENVTNNRSKSDFEGSAISRLASFGTSSPFAAFVNTKKDKEFTTSDRVVELESVEHPSKKIKMNDSNNSSTLSSYDEQQPPDQFLHLLSRSQDTTLQRLDTLELTLQTLLNSDPNEDFPTVDKCDDESDTFDHNTNNTSTTTIDTMIDITKNNYNTFDNNFASNTKLT